MSNTTIKKAEIKLLVSSLLTDFVESVDQQVNTALNCGALDVEGWNKDINPMILPRIIIVTIFQRAAEQFGARGTSWSKIINDEVSNLRCFL